MVCSLDMSLLATCLLGIFPTAFAATLPLHGRDQSRSGGVKLHKSCDPDTYDGAKAQMAIQDVARLVVAGLVAVAHPDQPPFNFFFKPRDAPTVEAVFNAIENSIDDGQGVTTEIWCRDYPAGGSIACGEGPYNDIALSTVPGPHGVDSSILMCPKALTLSRVPEPCVYRMGIYSIGWVLLEGLLRISELIGRELSDGPHLASECHALLRNGKADATHNIDSYLLLAHWSYNLGLGGDDGSTNNCVKQVLGTIPDQHVAFLDAEDAAKMDKSTWGVMNRTLSF